MQKLGRRCFKSRRDCLFIVTERLNAPCFLFFSGAGRSAGTGLERKARTAEKQKANAVEAWAVYKQQAIPTGFESSPGNETAGLRQGTANDACLWLVLAVCLTLGTSCFTASAQDSWQPSLQRMRLEQPVSRLDRTNCVAVMLKAFQSDPVVKALIFMPGATDELYMFHRVNAVITNSSPTLLDAVTSLTNQTFIHATFRPPFLLLHTDEDSLDLLVTVEKEKAAANLEKGGKLTRLLADDRDWDFIQPILRKTVSADIQPWRYSTGSWHFYRHSLAAWNLTGWEALQAVAYAGKTRITIRRKGILSIPRTEVVFEPDSRAGTVPKLEGFPR